MVFRPFDLARVLEVCYQADLAEDAWMQAVLVATRAGLDQGLGVQGFFADLSAPDQFVAWGLDTVGTDRATARSAFAAWNEAMPIAFKRRMFLFAPCGVGSFLPADLSALADRSNDSHGNLDMLGVNAFDASGRGCVLCAALPRPAAAPLSRGERALWGRIAAHLATADRARRGLLAADPTASAMTEAILCPSGELEHAEGPARDRRARELLKEAAIAIDHVRRRRDHVPAEEVAAMWQALVAGRWSLLEHFERDGRRYLIARRNEPAVQRPPLTAREAQAVRCAALGHSNKLIAYELGVSLSAVATYLRRAAARLGVSSRVALIRAFQDENER